MIAGFFFEAGIYYVVVTENVEFKGTHPSVCYVVAASACVSALLCRRPFVRSHMQGSTGRLQLVPRPTEKLLRSIQENYMQSSHRPLGKTPESIDVAGHTIAVSVW